MLIACINVIEIFAEVDCIDSNALVPCPCDNKDHILYSNQYLTFEQSPQEIIRVCLVLEKLSTQLDYLIDQSHPESARLFVETVLQYMNVADRPDFRNKMIRLLGQCSGYLAQVSEHPSVDQQAVQSLIDGFDADRDVLYQSPHKFGSEVRFSRLLQLCRKQSYSAGGVGDFHSPQLVMWLACDLATQRQSMQQWLDGLHPVRSVVARLLNVLRMIQLPQAMHSADNGSHQVNIDDRTSQLQLVRVQVPAELGVYAHINISSKRLFIHFYQQAELVSAEEDAAVADQQCQSAVPFHMACCYL